jgi:hypothetical protein
MSVRSDLDSESWLSRCGMQKPRWSWWWRNCALSCVAHIHRHFCVERNRNVLALGLLLLARERRQSNNLVPLGRGRFQGRRWWIAVLSPPWLFWTSVVPIIESTAQAIVSHGMPLLCDHMEQQLLDSRTGAPLLLALLALA